MSCAGRRCFQRSSALTQLIAHDYEAHEAVWLSGPTEIVVSVGAYGIVRAYNLRSRKYFITLLEISTFKVYCLWMTLAMQILS